MRRITYSRKLKLPFSSCGLAPWLSIVVPPTVIVPIALASPQIHRGGTLDSVSSGTRAPKTALSIEGRVCVVNTLI